MLLCSTNTPTPRTSPFSHPLSHYRGPKTSKMPLPPPPPLPLTQPPKRSWPQMNPWPRQARCPICSILVRSRGSCQSRRTYPAYRGRTWPAQQAMLGRERKAARECSYPKLRRSESGKKNLKYPSFTEQNFLPVFRQIIFVHGRPFAIALSVGVFNLLLLCICSLLGVGFIFNWCNLIASVKCNKIKKN